MPHWLRLVLFLVPVLLVVGLLHVFVYRRVRDSFRPPRVARVALAIVFATGPLALLVGRLLGRAGAGLDALSEALAVYGAIETLGVLLASVLLFPVALAERVGALVGRQRARRGAADATAPSAPEPRPAHARAEGAVPLPRRAFLGQVTTGGALLVAGGSSLYGGLFGRHDYQLEEIPIVLPGLPRALDGYTIVQLSDIHVGTFVQEPELRAAETLVRRARPDLVVLTGDLVDHDAAYAPTLGAFARRLEGIGRDGVAAIPGNHDYYAGVEEVLAALRGAGAKLLVNQGRLVGDRGGAFALLGVDDVWAPRSGGPGPDLERAIAMVPRDVPRVLLCHNPELFPEAAPHVDLQLSGHTHGGQVNFGVNTAELVLAHGYVRGHYRRGESQIYVNRGFGTAGPPSRIGSPPEVTKIVLVAG